MTSTNPEINFVQLPIGQLVPNTYNPNRLTDEQYQQLLHETQRLGRPPKPIIVRSSGESCEIVDGEHRWQAAQELGFGEVPCEIVEVVLLG